MGKSECDLLHMLFVACCVLSVGRTLLIVDWFVTLDGVSDIICSSSRVPVDRGAVFVMDCNLRPEA